MKLILLLMAMLAEPQSLTGKVVAITDGDCLTVLVDQREVKVRIHGIDSPERRQPFYRAASDHLGELTFGREVTIVHRGKKSYDRLVGKVFIGDRDIGLQQIAAGYAWHDPTYDQAPSYAAAEIDAREAHRGLWVDSDPVEPTQWRRRSRKKAGISHETSTPQGR